MKKYVIVLAWFFSTHLLAQPLPQMAPEQVLSAPPGEILLARPLEPAGLALVTAGGAQVHFPGKTENLPGRVLSATASRQGRFLAVLAEETPGAKASVRVFAADGQALVAIPIARHPDDPFPLIAVSDAAAATVLGFAATNELHFFDGDGQELRRLALFKPAAYDLETTLLLAFSADGERLAVAAMREAARPNHATASKNAALFLFRRDGTLLWQRTLALPSLEALAFSPGGQFIAVSTYDAYAGPEVIRRSTVFDLAGNDVLRLPHGFRQGQFGRDDSTLVVFTKNEIWQYRLPEATPQSHRKFLRKEGLIAAAAPAPNGQHLAVLRAHSVLRDGRFQFTRPRLQVFDASGTLVSSREAANATLRAPFLLALPARGFALFLNDRIERFNWPESHEK